MKTGVFQSDTVCSQIGQYVWDRWKISNNFPDSCYFHSIFPYLFLKIDSSTFVERSEKMDVLVHSPKNERYYMNNFVRMILDESPCRQIIYNVTRRQDNQISYNVHFLRSGI